LIHSGLANFRCGSRRLRAIGFVANRRLLDVEWLSHDCMLAETIFQAINSPDRRAWSTGQKASGLRFGVHVTLPLAFRISLPALNNNQIWSDELNVPEMVNVLLVIYVALVGVLVYVMGRWERAMRIPGYMT
jgi:ABC-type amino acid transport system permease subunit